jgi:hypothetical protein
VASAKFATALTHRKPYEITGDVDFWYKFAATGGAVVASEDGAVFVPAGAIRRDCPTDEAALFLHVIRASVDGNVNIAEVDEL